MGTTVYRKLTWYVKGLKEYTKNGFLTAAKSFNPTDLDVDLSGKVIVITGGNSGLGASAAQIIASKGAHVHIICRNIQKGESVKQEIIKSTKNENIFLHQLDLSSPSVVSKFAKDFVTKLPKIDVLVNNAGCMVNERKEVEGGLESNFATNTLGTHLLTVGLLPSLKSCDNPPARVITVSSGGMLLQKLNHNDFNFKNLQPFDGSMAYAQNKRQQVILTELYASKLSGSPASVMFFSCHPGWADTPSVAESLPEFYQSNQHKLRTVEQGADTIVWLAVVKNVPKQDNGAFFQDRVPVSKHLPLAWTKTSPNENEEFYTKLEAVANKYQ